MERSRGIVSVKYRFLRELHRTQLNEPLRMSQLRHRLSSAALAHEWLFEANLFRVSRTGKDGVQEPVTSNHDLEEAYRDAEHPSKVLRLDVPVAHPGSTCDVTGQTPIVGTMYTLLTPHDEVGYMWSCDACSLWNPLATTKCDMCSKSAPEIMTLCEAAWRNLPNTHPTYDPEKFHAVQVPSKNDLQLALEERTAAFRSQLLLEEAAEDMCVASAEETQDCLTSEAQAPPVPAVSNACRHSDCHLLMSSLQCCACADKRPVVDSYECYIDGQGFVLAAVREQNYCPACKSRGKTPTDPEELIDAARPAAAAAAPIKKKNLKQGPSVSKKMMGSSAGENAKKNTVAPKSKNAIREPARENASRNHKEEKETTTTSKPKKKKSVKGGASKSFRSTTPSKPQHSSSNLGDTDLLLPLCEAHIHRKRAGGTDSVMYRYDMEQRTKRELRRIQREEAAAAAAAAARTFADVHAEDDVRSGKNVQRQSLEELQLLKQRRKRDRKLRRLTASATRFFSRLKSKEQKFQEACQQVCEAWGSLSWEDLLPLYSRWSKARDARERFKQAAKKSAAVYTDCAEDNNSKKADPELLANLLCHKQLLDTQRAEAKRLQVSSYIHYKEMAERSAEIQVKLQAEREANEKEIANEEENPEALEDAGTSEWKEKIAAEKKATKAARAELRKQRRKAQRQANAAKVSERQQMASARARAAREATDDVTAMVRSMLDPAVGDWDVSAASPAVQKTYEALFQQLTVRVKAREQALAAFEEVLKGPATATTSTLGAEVVARHVDEREHAVQATEAACNDTLAQICALTM